MRLVNSNGCSALDRNRLVALSLSPLHAQDWPTRPIKLLVGFGAGGGTDIAARLVGQAMSEILGQPVVVENRVGAGGMTAADAVAKGAEGRHHGADDEQRARHLRRHVQDAALRSGQRLRDGVDGGDRRPRAGDAPGLSRQGSRRHRRAHQGKSRQVQFRQRRRRHHPAVRRRVDEADRRPRHARTCLIAARRRCSPGSFRATSRWCSS